MPQRTSLPTHHLIHPCWNLQVQITETQDQNSSFRNQRGGRGTILLPSSIECLSPGLLPLLLMLEPGGIPRAESSAGNARLQEDRPVAFIVKATADPPPQCFQTAAGGERRNEVRSVCIPRRVSRRPIVGRSGHSGRDLRESVHQPGLASDIILLGFEQCCCGPKKPDRD